MLKKNIYILYPAGFGGSYINWAIHYSDLDLRKNTVDNPINFTSSDAFGGRGTSHLHLRVPTHQSLIQHWYWYSNHKPSEPKVYLINTSRENSHVHIAHLMACDQTGVFISVHDEDNPLVESYATINCITKWPTYFQGLQYYDQFKKLGLESVNAFDSKDSLQFRNIAVLHHDTLLGTNKPINYTLLDRSLQEYKSWVTHRNLYQPHEVNDEQYITNLDYKDRIFQISAREIADYDFLRFFTHFLGDSGISDNYDFEYIKSFHRNYIDAQTNLQWFSSYRNWTRTGLLDDYLRSHSIIHAQLLRQIFKFSNIKFLNQPQKDSWEVFYHRVKANGLNDLVDKINYSQLTNQQQQALIKTIVDHLTHNNNEWPQQAPEEIYFYKLPQAVQQEILNTGRHLNFTQKPNYHLLDADWQNMTIDEINDLYQRTKQ